MAVEQTLEEIITSIISESVPAQLKKRGITPEKHLQKDLGLDSLRIASVVFSLQERLGVDLSNVDIVSVMGPMRTVADAIECGRRILQAAQSSPDVRP